MSSLVRSPIQPPVRLVSGTVFIGQSPPSSAEVKNKWRYTLTPPRCLYGLERDRVPFAVFYGCSLDEYYFNVMLLHWNWNVGFLNLVIAVIIGIWSLIPCRMTDFSFRFLSLASAYLPWSPVSWVPLLATAWNGPLALVTYECLESVRLFTAKRFIKAQGKCALACGSVCRQTLRHCDMRPESSFPFLVWDEDFCIIEEGSLGVAFSPGRKRKSLNVHKHTHTHTHTSVYIQGVPGGMCQTSGGCSLC